MNELGSFLKELRQLKTKSIRGASEEIGISHTYLDSLEKGYDPRTKKERKPTPEVLNKIAKYYGVPNGTLMLMAGYIDDPFEYANNQTKVESLAKEFGVSPKELFNLFNLLNMDGDLYYKEQLLNDSDKQKIKILLQTLLE